MSNGLIKDILVHNLGMKCVNARYEYIPKDLHFFADGTESHSIAKKIGFSVGTLVLV